MPPLRSARGAAAAPRSDSPASAATQPWRTRGAAWRRAASRGGERADRASGGGGGGRTRWMCCSRTRLAVRCTRAEAGAVAAAAGASSSAGRGRSPSPLPLRPAPPASASAPPPPPHTWCSERTKPQAPQSVQSASSHSTRCSASEAEQRGQASMGDGGRRLACNMYSKFAIAVASSKTRENTRIPTKEARDQACPRPPPIVATHARRRSIFRRQITKCVLLETEINANPNAM